MILWSIKESIMSEINNTPKNEMMDDVSVPENSTENTSSQETTTAEKSTARRKGYQFPPIQPVRRVGTLTLGLTLIVTGIIALIVMFYPQFNLTAIIKVTPVILIFLGGEILFAHIFHRGERLKYDFLSGFVCFILITAGGALSFIPIAWSYVGPPSLEARAQLRDTVEDTLYSELKNISEISDMYVTTELPYFKAYTPETDFSELTNDVSIHVRFYLSGDYPSKVEFAAACERILAQIKSLFPRYERISFNGGSQTSYELSLHGPFQLNMNSEELAQITNEYFSAADETEVTASMEVPAELTSEEAP